MEHRDNAKKQSQKKKQIVSVIRRKLSDHQGIYHGEWKQLTCSTRTSRPAQLWSVAL
jgi:hypothetical protein